METPSGLHLLPPETTELFVQESRGEFVGVVQLSERYTRDHLLRYAHDMGVLHGIVYLSGFDPMNVEIVITRTDGTDGLVMFDFGMLDRPFDEEMDMYIPQKQSDVELSVMYEEGILLTQSHPT